jgi:molybdopterin converting factor small subunit
VGRQVAQREDGVTKPMNDPQQPMTEGPTAETSDLPQLVSLRILLFAAARDLAGADDVTVDVQIPATAAAVLMALGDRFPPLSPLLPSCRLAVDQSFVAPGHAVYPHPELALIPPVSGG